MQPDDPFAPPPGGGIRRPTPGKPSADGPFTGETLVRPRPGPTVGQPGADETIVRPRGRPATARPTSPAQPQSGFGTADSRPDQFADSPSQSPAAPNTASQNPVLDPSKSPLPDVDDNPFILAARPLLSLVSRLRATVVCDNITGLQEELVGKIRTFQNRLAKRGVAPDQVNLASYAICSLLDEAVLNTPWASGSFWGNQTLLVIFHQEAFGGEKFFQFLAHLLRSPAQNRDITELLWVCLALGFEGKYRLAPHGANELERIRNETYRAIQQEPDPELSPRWHGVKDTRPPLIRHVPLWVVGSVAGGLLLLIYLGFVIGINGQSDAVARDFYSLTREEPALATRDGSRRAVEPLVIPSVKAERFKRILRTEIEMGQAEVVDDRILRIRNAFPAGSDKMKPDYGGLFAKIARELAAGGDTALVTGHTDDTPIFSARFPSNFELSTARARHVTDFMMATAHLNGKLRFEGRADYEPLVPNNTSENRAINRRVDILIQ